ncbi:unnamed protein product, partial [Phaeothamnion confervicola]
RQRAVVELRRREERLVNARRRLRLHFLDTDMERICHFIEQDIRESATSPREHKLLVAEFGLLDAQLSNLMRLIADISPAAAASGGSTEAWGAAPQAVDDDIDMLLVDDDELELVAREVTDLKQRLGMELQTPQLSVDGEKVARYLRDTLAKVKNGLDFYVTGTKLIGNDIQYAVFLISKAAQGYTLKPREVRTLRRTGKDVLTLIPFTIILIIPLSPVGHVLVFSFIQRFFPDFFPSTYTDRRQNLLKMYEEVEKKQEVLDQPGEDDVLEKLRRNFMATLNK